MGARLHVGYVQKVQRLLYSMDRKSCSDQLQIWTRSSLICQIRPNSQTGVYQEMDSAWTVWQGPCTDNDRDRMTQAALYLPKTLKICSCTDSCGRQTNSIYRQLYFTPAPMVVFDPGPCFSTGQSVFLLETSPSYQILGKEIIGVTTIFLS